MSIAIKTSPKNDPSWLNIFVSLFSIFFLRFFLENFSSPMNAAGDVPSWQAFLLHIPLSFLAIFLSLLLFVYFITKENIKKIAIFLTFAHLLLLFPPIFDFITNGTKPNSITGYQLLTTDKLFNYLIDVWSFQQIDGTSFGMRIAMITLALSTGFFIFKKTNHYLKASLGTLSVFFVMFFYANIPSFLMLFQPLQTELAPSIYAFNMLIKQSWTANAIPLLSRELAYDLIMSQIFFLLIVIQLTTLFYFLEKKTWLLIFRNLRPERIFNYCSLALIGMVIGQKNILDLSFFNIMNLVTFFVFICVLIINFLIAIFINDLYDISIDKVTNTERPLAKNLINEEKWKKLLVTFFVLFIFGLLTLNYRVGFFIILLQSLFFIYSAPPLKLKRHFIYASILIGLTTGCASLAGFFLVSTTSSLFAFPYKALLIIIFSQALLSNMKDLKDFTGDKNEHIQTIPVVFGFEKSKKIIAFLYILVFISIPLILHIDKMLFFAFCCSLFVSYLFTKKQFQEKYIFLLLFIYMLVLLFFLT